MLQVTDAEVNPMYHQTPRQELTTLDDLKLTEATWDQSSPKALQRRLRFEI
jgi:hypothetical protein